MSKSTAVAAQNVAARKQTPMDAFRDNCDIMKPELARAMPEHRRGDADRFMRALESSCNKVPKLLQANPKSLFGAAMACAEDGLIPNGREAALVPFKGDVTYIPMISGILKLMRNSDEVKEILSAVVYENDEFVFELGDEPRLVHRPAMQGDRGKMTGAYAVVTTKDDGKYREYMSRDQIIAVKKIVKANNTPWNGPFESEMWRKTVLRRLAKSCPLSSDRLIDLTSRDDDIYDLDAVALPAEPTKIEEVRRRLAEQNEATEPEEGAEVPQEPQEGHGEPETTGYAAQPEEAPSQDTQDIPEWEAERAAFKEKMKQCQDFGETKAEKAAFIEAREAWLTEDHKKELVNLEHERNMQITAAAKR